MPSLRPCPSETPGHLSGHPGLCSSCLCEHSCTYSSVSTHLPSWPILGTVAPPTPVWKEVGCKRVDPPSFLQARTKAVHGRQTAGRGGVDTSKCARAPSYLSLCLPLPTSGCPPLPPACSV